MIYINIYYKMTRWKINKINKQGYLKRGSTIIMILLFVRKDFCSYTLKSSSTCIRVYNIAFLYSGYDKYF